MSTIHRDLPDNELHPPGPVSEADPGSVGAGAGMDWYQPSTRRLRRRNAGDSGWDDLAVPGAVNAVTNYEHVLALTDAGGLVRLSDPSEAALIVPEDATVDFPVGSMVRVEQADEGVVTISAETSDPELLTFAGHTLAGQHAVATLTKVATNTWLLSGDLTSP